MAATIQLHVWTGAAAGTDGGSATSFSFLNIDSALDTAAARISNPITIPTSGCAYSYEKWISACVTASPANNVSNFQMWGTPPVQAFPTGTCWMVGTATSAAGSTPVNTAMAAGKSPSNLATATSGAKYTWDAASYAAAGSSTQYLVMQLHITTTACVGNWGGTGCALSYSYSEV